MPEQAPGEHGEHGPELYMPASEASPAQGPAKLPVKVCGVSGDTSARSQCRCPSLSASYRTWCLRSCSSCRTSTQQCRGITMDNAAEPLTCQDRQRTRSCAECRRRRIRCEGHTTPCRQCVYYQVPHLCHYPVRKRRHVYSARSVTALGCRPDGGLTSVQRVRRAVGCL